MSYYVLGAKTRQNIPDPRTQNMMAWLEGWSSPTRENILTRFFISPVPSQSELLHADQAGAGACIVNAGLWSNFLRWLLLCHLPQLVSIFSVQLK